MKLAKIETRYPAAVAFELKIKELRSAIYRCWQFTGAAIHGLMKAAAGLTLKERAAMLYELSALSV